jgi:hypothetical protein
VHYARKVLLTFASDGLHTAQQIAREFRKERENLLRIGVVILNEHSDHVNNNPEQFISDCFRQVKLESEIFYKVRTFNLPDCYDRKQIM